MKKMLLLSIAVVCCLNLFAQGTDIPNVTLKDMNGKDYNLNQLNNAEKPVVLSFWATWCGPCLKELDAISQVYADWQDETGVEIIAISVDDSRTVRRVKPLVNGKAWDYTILLDENQDVKRRMNVGHPPHTFVVYKGKIVYQHTGYSPGAENKLFEEIKKCINN